MFHLIMSHSFTRDNEQLYLLADADMLDELWSFQCMMQK